MFSSTAPAHASPASRRRVAVAGLFLWALAAAGCERGSSGASAPAQPLDAETRSMVQRLRAHANNPRLANPFDQGPQARTIESQLARDITASERFDLLTELADIKNTSGDPRAALAALEESEKLLLERRVTLTRQGDEARRWLTLSSHLRIGEVENCLARHNQDCCLFPIRDGGIHAARAGFEEAERLLLKELEQDPDSLAHRWLLTVVAMGLGKYPHAADPRRVLSPGVMESEQPFPRFPQVAAEIGIAVDDIAGGTAVDDFSGDGRLDVFLSSWSKSGQLRYFVNNGGGRFTEETAAAGLEGITGGLNLLQADHDNDGNLDLYVVRGAWLDQGGQDPDSLLRNNGDGTFSDRTHTSGLLSLKPALTAVWCDFNLDGWIDIYIGCESIAQTEFPAELYLNRGNGTFTEAARASGVAVVGLIRGVSAQDFDNDGWPDLYVSRLGQPNLLFRNCGRPAETAGGWCFEDVTARAGVADPLLSFPCWAWDYDNDGWLDLFTAGYTLDFGPATLEELVKDMLGQPSRLEKPRLYRNRGDGTFADVSRDVGLHRVLYAMGANFGDLDNDGFLDFYAGTGDPNLTTLVPNRMFRNDRGVRFLDVTTAGGFGHLQKGHAVAFGDLDDDGDQEVVINLGGAARGDNFLDAVFRNPGFGNRWISLTLAGTRTNRAAIGARVKVVVEGRDGDRAIHRTVCSGGSFGASPLRLELGLGACERVRELEIYWPASRVTDTFTAVELDTRYRCVEGSGVLTPAGSHRS